MKTYTGTIIGNDDDRIVTVTEGAAQPYTLGLRLDLRSHSPTGFAWGYPGSGPAQLALALCADVYGDAIGARPAVYQRVKDALIQALPIDEPFTLTEAQIRDVVREHAAPFVEDAP